MTAIEWTDQTWNPVTGCDRVSPGCAHCYALDLAARWKAMGQPRYQRDGGRTSGPGFGVTLQVDKLNDPLRWRRPRRVFVNSMSDLFHEEIPAEYIARVFGVMAAATRHTFQVLTKRPERMAELLRDPEFQHNVRSTAGQLGDVLPLPNVWLGVSVENRRFVYRADVLRSVSAAVRFISAEPLLGSLEGLDLTGIDWLIVGGESGAAHRPIKSAWVEELRALASDAGVAFFLKQDSGSRPGQRGRFADEQKWPREMPAASGGDDHVGERQRPTADAGSRVDRMRALAARPRCSCVDGGHPTSDGRCERCFAFRSGQPNHQTKE